MPFVVAAPTTMRCSKHVLAEAGRRIRVPPTAAMANLLTTNERLGHRRLPLPGINFQG
ncbi:hypothetical protein LGM35_09890 [Burkholderia cenocepacia]|uniref:hypothetical protein n=1 Tax=Burkholderia cenocepacia TaxID=95486 RepID=UPI001CF1A359|nr:hypothetical protein [Burkholderia cenocepacia]MCA7922800.1 hypothetical protein [Burkholderia cenocepacia]